MASREAMLAKQQQQQQQYEQQQQQQQQQQPLSSTCMSFEIASALLAALLLVSIVLIIVMYNLRHKAILKKRRLRRCILRCNDIDGYIRQASTLSSAISLIVSDKKVGDEGAGVQPPRQVSWDMPAHVINRSSRIEIV